MKNNQNLTMLLELFKNKYPNDATEITKYKFIYLHRKDVNISRLCEELKVNRNKYNKYAVHFRYENKLNELRKEKPRTQVSKLMLKVEEGKLKKEYERVCKSHKIKVSSSLKFNTLNPKGIKPESYYTHFENEADEFNQMASDEILERCCTVMVHEEKQQREHEELAQMALDELTERDYYEHDSNEDDEWDDLEYSFNAWDEYSLDKFRLNQEMKRQGIIPE